MDPLAALDFTAVVTAILAWWTFIGVAVVAILAVCALIRAFREQALRFRDIPGAAGAAIGNSNIFAPDPAETPGDGSHPDPSFSPPPIYLGPPAPASLAVARSVPALRPASGSVADDECPEPGPLDGLAQACYLNRSYTAAHETTRAHLKNLPAERWVVEELVALPGASELVPFLVLGEHGAFVVFPNDGLWWPEDVFMLRELGAAASALLPDYGAPVHSCFYHPGWAYSPTVFHDGKTGAGAWLVGAGSLPGWMASFGDPGFAPDELEVLRDPHDVVSSLPSPVADPLLGRSPRYG